MNVRGPISIAAQAGDNPNNGHKEVVFKNFALFTDCISKINNTQIDNAKDLDAVMSMFNLKEYFDNYSKTTGSLWLYYRDEPAFTDASTFADFCAADNSSTFKFKQKSIGKTNAANRRKDVEINDKS